MWIQLLSVCPKMQNSEKLCLKWNDFQENLNSAFGTLRNDKDFSDVTLACEDGTQVESHKVILASSSPFFMEILKRNKHPHPLIYMRGVKADDLVAIVDFLYFGETNVKQENLEAFLALAQELKLRGLTGPVEETEKRFIPEIPQEKKMGFKKHKTETIRNATNPIEIYNSSDEGKSSTISPVALVNSTDVQQLDEQIKSMMDISEKMTTDGSQKARKCKVCGKEGWRRNIMTHIEANHIISDVSHPCDICGKVSRSRHGLRLLKKAHNELQYITGQGMV